MRRKKQFLKIENKMKQMNPWHIDGLGTQRGIIISHLKFNNLYIAWSIEPMGKKRTVKKV